jgi:citrate synthase
MESIYLSARETAERLGIKRDTLYAYVSRGLLRSVAVPGSRERGYRTEEVERLRAGRGLSRATRSEPFVPVIASAICLIEGGRLYYRGHDAIRLAETTTLEDMAGLLWGQDPISIFRHSQRSEARRIGGRFGTAASLGAIERCQVRLAELAAADLGALDLTPHGIVRTGRTILYELVACIGDQPTAPDPVHEQLAALWHLDDQGADLIRRCLVLLADHELNASTFVARCVASTGATPYAVVSGALAALSGRRHGGASASAEALLHEIAERDDPLAVMAARLARNEMLPGLGHPFYPAGDPRAAALLNAAMAAIPASRPLIEAAVAAARQLVPQPPNVDFALAAATTALGLPQGAALGLFVVGRTVGWIAHAIEQYQSGVLIRPRARYTGPRPVAAA